MDHRGAAGEAGVLQPPASALTKHPGASHPATSPSTDQPHSCLSLSSLVQFSEGSETPPSVRRRVRATRGPPPEATSPPGPKARSARSGAALAAFAGWGRGGFSAV